MKLSSKLLILSVSISVVLVLVVALVVYNRLWNERLALVEDGISQQLRDFDFALTSYFAEAEGDVATLVDSEFVRSRDDAGFTNFLQADETTFQYNYGELEQKIIRIFNVYRLTHPYVNAVYMGRENGAFVRSHPRASPTQYDPRDRPWYILAKSNPADVMETDAYPSLTTNDVNIAIVKGLLDENGVFYGVVGVDVTLVKLTTYLLGYKIGPTGKIFLVDKNGVVLASQVDGLQGKRIEEYAPALPALLAKDEPGFTPVDIDGQRNLLFHRLSSRLDWQMAVVIPSADIERQIRDSVLGTALILALGLASISILILYGLQRMVVRPLKQLTADTELISRTGNLDCRISIHSRDEIGELASSYNVMIGALGQSKKSLEETQKDLTAYRDHLEELVQQRTRELESTLTELEVQKDRAEAADRLKSAFLATMSHELRTPLNSIIGFTGIMLQGLAGPLNPEQGKQLGMVQSSARHLLALINDVLDISKIEAGQLTVSREPFDLRASIGKVADTVRPLAEKKGLALNVELAPEIGPLVSDPRRVEQILLNLINNAIKFTEKGAVTLTADVVPVGAGAADHVVRVAISDTGIGIKPEDLATLFQPFRQIDTGLSRQHEGTGLGLAICRRLVDLLGGQISASSEWGKGSVFRFTLPADGESAP